MAVKTEYEKHTLLKIVSRNFLVWKFCGKAQQENRLNYGFLSSVWDHFWQRTWGLLLTKFNLNSYGHKTFSVIFYGLTFNFSETTKATIVHFHVKCYFNPLQPWLAFHIETSHLTFNANQMTGFSKKWNTGLEWFKRRLL